MSMDAISEKIAHFIGAFELVEQEARMRAEYDKFRAIKAEEDDPDAIELRSLKVKESYKLEDVDAGVKVKPTPPVKLASEQVGAVVNEVPLVSGPNGPALDLFQSGNLAGILGMQKSISTLNFQLPPPSSMAQVTYQINALSDNDSFGAVSTSGFAAISGLNETLQMLFTAVSNLSPLEIDLLPTSANWSILVTEIQDNAQALLTGTEKILTTSVLLGEHAYGTFADGAAITKFTPFEELLPTYIADKRAQAEADAEPHDPTTDGHDFAQDFGKDESPFKVDEGHEVVAGANTLVNTASITSTWLDADVIAVAGDVVRMDAISQINVIVDHDSITDALSSNDLADQSSMASNAAAIVIKSVAAARADADADAGDVPDSTPSFSGTPANWAVVRHDGPVTQINWVKQHSFTTDFDQAVVTFSGAATFLGLGENALSNSFKALEFGYQYDLILVAGNLIDINMIDQLNIILDSDVVDTIAPVQAASAQPEPVEDMPAAAETAATLTVAEIGAEDSGRVGPNDMVPDHQDETQPDSVAQKNAYDQPAVLKGSGTNGSSQQAAATSGLPDIAPAETKAHTASPIEVADNEPVSLPDNPSPTPAPAVSSGDNLAYNQASIQTIGEDTDAAITDIFSDALDNFADGDDEISDDIVKDPAFTGTELLRVLYIDGDFTTVNMVEQINVLGDADQVHLARDNFAAALQKQIEITTGSNVAANIAAIQDNGLDSTVMARGKVYSDALIHQANLMDTDVLETGSSVAELANEAVAFLTDDISAGSIGDDTSAMTDGTTAEAFGHSDIMQTMLS